MGWALDEDYMLTRRALEGIVDITGLENCQVIHSIWWEGIKTIPEEYLEGRRVICHVPGEPYRYLSMPGHSLDMQKIGLWIAQTNEAGRQLADLRLKSICIPYAVDTDIFHPIEKDDTRIEGVREQWNIPAGKYLIGSFQRDTEGKDLKSPKLVKGPDVFAEIVSGLVKKGYPLHVVLCGPRRFWLRRRLGELDVPFTFIGSETGNDDIAENNQPHSLVNVLYNMLDLYIVSSRSEGGPRSILEAAAARCKIISTQVGLAPDVLETECIYCRPDEAAGLAAKDMDSGYLSRFTGTHYEKVITNHGKDVTIPLFKKLYEDIDSVPVCLNKDRKGRKKPPALALKRWAAFFPFRGFKPFSKSAGRGDCLTVSFWHKFAAPPRGGGNQFMIALQDAFEKKGIRVLVNETGKYIDAHLLNSIWFDVDKFRRGGIGRNARIVHRIDGPIHLIRGRDRELDDLCFDLNARYATSTVLQSAWNMKRILSAGYRPVRPVIIHNAVNPGIFNATGRVEFRRGRKIRLISTSWSGNPRKGGQIYKWLEDHLDWSRFEYTFVGNSSEGFSRVRHLPAVASSELASFLRENDIYITASSNDPCSNALIEALACGLPSLYLNDGGHPELAGFGGLPFSHKEDILPQLENIVENYETYQRLIAVPEMEDVASRYLELLKD